MAITRITALWSGFRGAPGYSNFFFGTAPGNEEEARLCAVAVRNFFFGMNAQLPSDVTISVSPVADVIDEANGNIIEQVDYEAPPVVNGVATGSYSAASGAVVNWNTSAYVNGRRVRGRTFIVPLSSLSYDGQGDLNTETLGDLRDSANALVAGANPLPFVIWRRPVGGSGGTAHPVVSATVPDLGAILRSRRD